MSPRRVSGFRLRRGLLSFRFADCCPSFLGGRDYSSPASSTELALGLRRFSLSSFQRGPPLPLCSRDSSASGFAHRPSFRSCVPLMVWRSFCTPRTAMAELSLNLCDGRFYFGFLTFVADQRSPEESVIREFVSCHFVNSLRGMLISNSWCLQRCLQNAPRF